MELKVLKTSEITDSQWCQIIDGFNEAFGAKVSIDTLKYGFCTQNKLGYGYHAIALSDDGELMGFNTFSPGFYKNGLKTVFSGSVFVRKKFRTNDFLLMDLTNSLRKRAIEDGYEVELGAPNSNAETFSSKVLKCIHIADLNYYILPIHPSHCLNKRSIRIIDPITSFLCRSHIFFMDYVSSIFNCKEKKVKYEMVTDDDYASYRFPSRQYKEYKDGQFEAHYRLYNENGALTAYLMDFRENGIRTSRSLNKAVKFILKNEKIDAVMFVGLLKLCQYSLFKVPTKFVPKRIPFTYHVLNKNQKDKFADMGNADNWNFSLMNFDVR